VNDRVPSRQKNRNKIAPISGEIPENVQRSILLSGLFVNRVRDENEYVSAANHFLNVSCRDTVSRDGIDRPGFDRLRKPNLIAPTSHDRIHSPQEKQSGATLVFESINFPIVGHGLASTQSIHSVQDE
jgi:hypothetical protein